MRWNHVYTELMHKINDIECEHSREGKGMKYNMGWDDAMCTMETMIDTVFREVAEKEQAEEEKGTQDMMKTVCLQKEPAVNDPVNHPGHYTSGSIEVIDYIEDQKLPYHLGNAVKYISRAGKKDPDKTVEDLKKAAWYISRYIEKLEQEAEALAWTD